MKKRIIVYFMTFILIIVSLFGCGKQDEKEKTDKPIIKNTNGVSWNKENYFKVAVKKGEKDLECVMVASPQKNNRCKLKALSCFDNKLNNADLGTIKLDKNKAYLEKSNKDYKIQKITQVSDDLIELKRKRKKDLVDYRYYSISKKKFSDTYLNVYARYENLVACPYQGYGYAEVGVEELFTEKTFEKFFESYCIRKADEKEAKIDSVRFISKSKIEFKYTEDEEVGTEIIDLNEMSDEEIAKLAVNQYKESGEYSGGYSDKDFSVIIEGAELNGEVELRLYLAGYGASSTVGRYIVNRKTDEITKIEEEY